MAYESSSNMLLLKTLLLKLLFLVLSQLLVDRFVLPTLQEGLTAVVPNTNPIITRGALNSTEHDALANLKKKINPRVDLRKSTRVNSSLAIIVVIPEELDTTEPDYAQLCPPITKLRDLPAIDLSTCSLNTQPVINSYGSYNVPADNSPNNNGFRNNSLLNAATSSLDSSQDGDDTSVSLGGGSDSTTQDLEKKSANKELSLLCRNVNPYIIFLSETKMNKDMATRKLRNMGFPCTFNIPSIGRSGGLALAWKKEIHPNIVLSNMRGTEDKNGGLEVDDPDFENLRNFCSVFNLHDPGFSEPRFTWSNMQHGPDLIPERLDRCLLNQTAEDLCPKLRVNNLPRDSSDHFPMHISFNYEDICSPTYKLKDKLLSTKKGLRHWNKSSFGNIQTNISTIKKDLADPQLFKPTDTGNTSRLKAILEYLYNLEELYWKDKSMEVWFMEDYFKSLYSSHPQQFQDEILDDFPIKFSAEDNTLLIMPLSLEEIKNVVFQMGGKKAPGPDGFTSIFYQKYRDIVGDAVIDMTQTCFRIEHIAKVFNHTNIAIIPKVPLAELVTQYRPIGLCNFIYKILSKNLANRLEPFMNNIISQNKIAFIPKRSISDNILLANEAIYAVNHNDKVEGIVAVKLYMSKDYDKLECDFLEKVLTKMGLYNHWVKLINQCVSIVSHSIILNGIPTCFFQPERGLIQGDPLSPYLYIICSEALSSYIDSLQKKVILEGIKVCKDPPEMTC
ncbi:uncharacterized protein LOC113324400 [Papaver somniferum]|uniref:uncharacterized protein LOC113324400 n=1 Tax=Papaver somniferum TaxID=3469 RepID=UPI000E701A2E|nr:uncharacterized protein LOC113324400 [Papaver somniferum]